MEKRQPIVVTKDQLLDYYLNSKKTNRVVVQRLLQKMFHTRCKPLPRLVWHTKLSTFYKAVLDETAAPVDFGSFSMVTNNEFAGNVGRIRNLVVENAKFLHGEAVDSKTKKLWATVSALICSTTVLSVLKRTPGLYDEYLSIRFDKKPKEMSRNDKRYRQEWFTSQRRGELFSKLSEERVTFYMSTKAIHVLESYDNITFDATFRPHNPTGPVMSWGDEHIYALQGLIVPEHVVMRPETITIKEVQSETNAELRRVYIEQMGYQRYISDGGMELVDSCPEDHPIIGLRTAKLWRDPAGVTLLDMLNSTPEPDGTTKRYVLGITADAYDGRAGRECLAAMASTWRHRSDMTRLVFEKPEDYAPAFES